MGTSLVEHRRYVGVAGEHEHLPIGSLLGEKLNEHPGCRAGPRVVEVDQRVVHHDRQRHVMAAQIPYQRQPQSEEDLLPRTAAEPLGPPELAVALVDFQTSFVDRGRDRMVATFGKPTQPAGRLSEDRRLVISRHGSPGVFQQGAGPLEHPAAVPLLDDHLLDAGEFRLERFGAAIGGSVSAAWYPA